jgi:hypothetical protein
MLKWDVLKLKPLFYHINNEFWENLKGCVTQFMNVPLHFQSHKLFKALSKILWFRAWGILKNSSQNIGLSIVCEVYVGVGVSYHIYFEWFCDFSLFNLLPTRIRLQYLYFLPPTSKYCSSNKTPLHPPLKLDLLWRTNETKVKFIDKNLWDEFVAMAERKKADCKHHRASVVNKCISLEESLQPRQHSQESKVF